MSRRASPRLLGAAVAWVLCVHAALSGTVTLNVKDLSGSAAAGTLIIFDPLDAPAQPSQDAAIIDQIDKRFVPQISVVRTGTTVMFPNSDHIRHQVYSFSPAKIFTLKLYAGSPRTDVVFDKPGLVVLGCNIHDTMVAFVGVVDTPYFAKIPPAGDADITLPTGRYRMRVWHPALKAAIPSHQIEVGSDPMTIPLTVDIDAAGDAVAAWPE